MEKKSMCQIKYNKNMIKIFYKYKDLLSLPGRRFVSLSRLYQLAVRSDIRRYRNCEVAHGSREEVETKSK
jgi:hypothetical protein